MSSTNTEHAARRPGLAVPLCVCALFVVSGAAGLTYQVAWQHLFSTVFGSTTYAVSVVIAVFMAGLAIGSYVFGVVADRTQRYLAIYALLQLGIAGFGAVVPWLVGRMEGIYAAVYSSTQSAGLLLAVQAACSAAVLLPPTILMGGTLPLLSRFMAEREGSVAPAVGLLYGLNTLGAAGGAFLTGFVLIKAFGTTVTIMLAAGVNVALAGAFLMLSLAGRGEKGAAPSVLPEPAAAERAAIPAPAIALAVCVSGFVSFSYEVLWTRLLAFQFEATVYAFTVMIATFLLGLGLGGALTGVLARTRVRRHYGLLFGCLQLGIGLYGLGAIGLFRGRPAFHAGFGSVVLSLFSSSATIMAVPTVLLGMAFPIACALWARTVERTGRSIGAIYVANTAGAVLGALLTGFWLARALGTQLSLTAASLLMLASGTAVLTAARASGRGERLGRIAVSAACWAAALAVCLLLPADLLPRYYVRAQARGSERTLLGYAEGVEGIAVASELPEGDKSLSVGSTLVAGTAFRLRNTQKLQAHVPMLIHPDPREVCQVGFGSGETARIFTSYDVDRYDCVEINPAVLTLSDECFRDISDRVIHRGNFNAIIMDAAVYLRYGGRSYDVIANDATWPHLAGCSALYALEYFRNGLLHLKPGGIMTSWLPIESPPEDFRIVLRTFHEVFPHVYVWVALSHFNKHALLVGSREPLTIDVGTFLRRFDERVRRDLAPVYLDDPAAFLTCQVASMARLAPAIGSGPLNTNDWPILQYADRRLMGPDAMVASSFRLLARGYDPITDRLTGLDGLDDGGALEERIGLFVKVNEILLDAMGQSMTDPAASARAYERARDLMPDHPFFRRQAARRAELMVLSREQITGRDLPALVGLVDELGRFGLFPQAQAALEEWERREPASPYVQERLGAVSLKLGLPDRAVEHLTAARSLGLDTADVNRNLGAAYIDLGRYPDAVRVLERARELSPRSADVLDRLGTAVALTGDSDRALALFREATEIDPELPSAQQDMAVLLSRMGRPAEAVPFARRLVKLQPDSPQAHDLLSRLLTAVGDPDGAAAHAARAAELRAAQGR